jgi:YD repeat-containing protein
MTPRSGRASWWCSFTTLGHTHFSFASTGPRSSRRSPLRALALISATLSLGRDAYAQTDANRFCRDCNHDGYCDCAWLLTSVALPDGASLTYIYAAAHRLTAIADHQDSRVDYSLDAMGNCITERATDIGGTLVKNIQRSIDALNRVPQVIGAD